MELADVLLTKSGGETERQVYLARSTGAAARGHEPDLALRFDLTVPLARYVAQHEGQLAFPFRRYQIQPVFRGESPQQGRFREFWQCDIDVIGHGELSVRYDAEMPAVINTIFTRLEIGEFMIRLNNRRLLRGLLSGARVEPRLHDSALRELDKLARLGAERVKAGLIEAGVPVPAADHLLAVTGVGAVNGDQAADYLSTLQGDDPLLIQGKAELLEVVELLAAQRVPPSRFCVDLSIARGLDYYTGTVYETTLVDRPGLGSVCSGGRYDDLAGFYTRSRLPGVGISIGLTRLFWQLRELGQLSTGPSLVTALVGLIDAEGTATALGLAARLRDAGINTETVLEPGRMQKHLRYADRVGIPFYLVAGPEERVRGSVLIRDLRFKTQTEATPDTVVEMVSRLLTAGGE
jgi:histidyl-tRNA synthetase